MTASWLGFLPKLLAELAPALCVVLWSRLPQLPEARPVSWLLLHPSTVKHHRSFLPLPLIERNPRFDPGPFSAVNLDVLTLFLLFN
jgi:hypothetical protein